MPTTVDAGNCAEHRRLTDRLEHIEDDFENLANKISSIADEVKKIAVKQAYMGGMAATGSIVGGILTAIAIHYLTRS